MTLCIICEADFEDMSELDYNSEADDIYTFYSSQDMIYLGPVCHVADLPDAYQLTKEIVTRRDDAELFFSHGVKHNCPKVVAYCISGLTRLLALKAQDGVLTEEHYDQLIADIESNLQDKAQEVKCRLGSFAYSRSLVELLRRG